MINVGQRLVAIGLIEVFAPSGLHYYAVAYGRQLQEVVSSCCRPSAPRHGIRDSMPFRPHV